MHWEMWVLVSGGSVKLLSVPTRIGGIGHANGLRNPPEPERGLIRTDLG